MTNAVQNRPAFDVRKAREDFPILATKVHGKPLIYLDNAATTQKPRAVIDAILRYYEGQNSNIHRGVHHLSEVATRAYESARVKVQRFLNAADSREIIFTRGATESTAATYSAHSCRPSTEPMQSARRSPSDSRKCRTKSTATSA